ncbi:hypothetical protein VTI74DRAFT_5436 [Chaetomium olivicolor]
MGPLKVLKMPESDPPTASTTQRPMHPFFAQSRPCTPVVDKLLVKDAAIASDNPAVPSDITVDGKRGNAVVEPTTKRGRRRKADQELDDGGQHKVQPKKRTRDSADWSIANHFVKLGKSSGDGGGKQDDTSPHSDAAPSPEEEGLNNIVNEVGSGNRGSYADTPNIEAPEMAGSGAGPNGCDSQLAPSSTTTNGGPAKPTKLLRLNPKTGTIGSPPKQKEPKVAAREDAHENEKMLATRRGRKRPPKIVRITYGPDTKSRIKLGQMIDAILAGQMQHPVAGSKKSPSSGTKKQSSKASKVPTQKPSKVTHPFFQGQSKKAGSAAPDNDSKKPALSPLSGRTKHYSVTPCSPRKPRTGPSKILMPKFGMKSLGLKFPGAKLPAWPCEGMVHVRGDDGATAHLKEMPLPLHLRKSKGNAVKIAPIESVVDLATQSMDIARMAEAVRNINTDEIIPPPPELRLPQKHFESGSKLQARILPQLKTPQPTAREPGAGKSTATTMRIPPQLIRLFDSIASSLSAFDLSQCETTNWVQKYAPINTVEVLQPGREAYFLREWLQALMVQSVDTGSADADKPKTGSKGKAVGPGKKKRRKKLDGFIVSSEDENYELYELSEEDDDWAPSGSRGILRKTVIRSGNLSKGKDGERIANTLVISGPHGCGKTAAVYAVAKELDYEVFEINASSRRSGKDVLDKIGDMTRNHHVRQQQSSSMADDEAAAEEDDTAKDIKSGKQVTMNSFFKPKSNAAKPKQPAKPAKAQSEAKKEPPKNQRQSLILLEEIDILYEEDKQFWTTVVGLITQAKRPFIMTCNDETLVPLHTLNLHGIFRLSTPPKDLAVDRLLLIAANEGHALTRQSVEQLYDSRKRDLRAATMDLQYWCQIGVGDRRGGFDWFYPRWPKGIDLDENNEVVRVISQDTYLPGMNLLGRDSIIASYLSPREVEEEILHQTWESWGLDMGHWQDSVGLGLWAESLGPNITTPADRLRVLEAYDGLANAMSAADVCSAGAFAAFKEESMDTTQPLPPAKTRDDFPLGIIHLETPTITHHHTLPTSIATTLKSLAKSTLYSHTSHLEHPPPSTLLPLTEPLAIHHLQTSFTTPLPGTLSISRMDFAFAFDPIAAPDTSSSTPQSYLEPSVFDRTLRLIVLEVAPYVRGIVAYDAHLAKQRLKMSTMVSERGTSAAGSGGGESRGGRKRMRTTRAALSALEGGERRTTRGKRWFKAEVNPHLVGKTAGRGWERFWVQEENEKEVAMSPESSPKWDEEGEGEEMASETAPTKREKRVAPKIRNRKKVLKEQDEEEDGLGC